MALRVFAPFSLLLPAASRRTPLPTAAHYFFTNRLTQLGVPLNLKSVGKVWAHVKAKIFLFDTAVKRLGVIMTLLEYLDKNKDWLFSGGGIVLLGCIGALLKRWFFRERASSGGQIENCPANSANLSQNKRSDSYRNVPPEPVAKIAQVVNNTPIASSAATATTSPLTRISPITPDMIIDALEKLPPFQQEDAAKHYVGLEVQWDSNLCSASKKGDDDVVVFLSVKDVRTRIIQCQVRYSECRMLGILKKGSQITVMGRIKAIGILNTIELEDAHLTFHNSPSDNRA
jgi:hypothetical protein